MDQKDIYRQFIDWLNQRWWGLPPAAELLPLFPTCYTPEEAQLLTGIPFWRSLEELAAAKGMEPSALAPRMDRLAQKVCLPHRRGKYRPVQPERFLLRLPAESILAREEG